MSRVDIRVYRDLMGANDEWAARSRTLMAQHDVAMLNIIGSPGCGKTALLEAMGRQQGRTMPFAVLEGDVETSRDAERLAALDIPASQLLTGGACHLEAKLVHYALKDLDLSALDLVIVENVGNLVCPAEFDVGEGAKVAVLSVTEGEDKPLKYPLLFREASVILLTKIDLLPHLTFDLPACRDYVRQINGEAPILEVSAVSGAGMEAWLSWVSDFRRTEVGV